jgi:hypothetical protein
MSNEKLPGKNGFKHIVVTTQLYLNESENTEARENFLLTMNAMEWPERSHGGDMVGRGARPAARKTAAMPTILGAPESMRLRGDSELQGGPVESLGGTRGSRELRRLTAAVGLGFQAWCGRTPYIEYWGWDVLWGERASRETSWRSHPIERWQQEVAIEALAQDTQVVAVQSKKTRSRTCKGPPGSWGIFWNFKNRFKTIVFCYLANFWSSKITLDFK